jgi:hypothetical protein
MSKNWNPAGNPQIGEVRLTEPDHERSDADEEGVAIPLDGDAAFRPSVRVDPPSGPADD